MGVVCAYSLAKYDALILGRDGFTNLVWRRGTLSGLWVLGGSELFAKVIIISPGDLKIAFVCIS